MANSDPNPNRAIPPGIRDPARRVVSTRDIGDRVTYTLYSTETPEGDHFKIRCVVLPGGGVPLHYHRNTKEKFEVLRGVLTAVNGSDVLSLGVGESTEVPVGVDHLFRNDSESEAEFEGTVSAYDIP